MTKKGEKKGTLEIFVGLIAKQDVLRESGNGKWKCEKKQKKRWFWGGRHVFLFEGHFWTNSQVSPLSLLIAVSH